MKKSSLNVDILNIKGEKVDTLNLDADVFDGKVNKELLHQVITAYLANTRKGTASTKTRAEVRGGGKKPWRQKGTGRARAGSIRSPIWRGGGIVFGPKPRDYSVAIPKKMKRQALKSSLNAKLLDNELLFLDDFKIEDSKTKSFMQVVKSLGLEKIKSLFILNEISANMRLSGRNIPYIFLINPKNVTAHDILNYKNIVLTKAGLNDIVARIKKT